MPELLLGGSGRLGASLRAHRAVTAPTRSELDLSTADDAGLKPWIGDASVVLNAAAMARVDACEARLGETERINAVVPGQLARLCEAARTPLIHISTDYVFGDGDGPWTEESERRPVQAYGASKGRGEAAALVYGATVVRVSWLFGADVGPFRQHVLAQADRGSVGVFAQQQSRPTSIESLVVWLFALADHLEAGGSTPPILHPAGGPWASRSDWARTILDCRGLQAVDVIDQGTPTLAARRPDDSRLDATRTQAWSRSVGLPEIEDWRDAVARLSRSTP